ncbi:hypothetical protein GCM10010980_15520 [Corynebacterium marinum]|nr:hypothetical protein GCM10010980_15520 [Corynebacterium marinum]
MLGFGVKVSITVGSLSGREMLAVEAGQGRCLPPRGTPVAEGSGPPWPAHCENEVGHI